MSNTIRVGIADMNLCKAPDKITTIGLGSCVGLVLYDESVKGAGLIHVMLPDSTKIKNNQNKMKFADSGVDLLIEKMLEAGYRKTSLKAKIAGGAKMFNFSGTSDLASIGDKNVEAVKAALKKHNIPLIASDVGLNYGRTIVFDPETFKLEVITAGKQSKVI